jgi:Zn-dependent metalloprotease
MYSGKVDIGATKNADGTWKLLDTSRGQGIETRDAMNKTSNTGAKQINDDDNVWGEKTDPARNQAAVDAQYGAAMTYDLYKNLLGRNSIDGKGEKLVSNIHIDKNYVNAYWDGSQMNYGDGDGKDATALTALDIAAHEITHGLTERTANLNYEGESGGVNEAMSDILGKGVEWYAAQQNPNVKFTWGVGERVWTPGTPGDALRYMNDPTKDGYSVDNYKDYPKQTEVHGSSGIMNNAFTLLVEGGTNRTSGIKVDSQVGMNDAVKIYGRALTTYMTPTTSFAQAREATIKAATDLYGKDSVQVQKVKDSWHAVGVG